MFPKILVGRPIVRDLEEMAEEDVAIVGLLRRGVVYGAPSSYEVIDADDIFIVEADPEDLQSFTDSTGFVLEGSRDMRAEIDQSLSSEDVSLVEAIVGPDSDARGKTARGLHLHAAFGVNLLGVSRRGTRLARRLGRIAFRPGDVLLLQGRTEWVSGGTASGLVSCRWPSASFGLGNDNVFFFPVAVFVGTVLFGQLSKSCRFNLAFVGAGLPGTSVDPKFSRFAAYRAIDWPVIFLLGAMIPVGEALETTGGCGACRDGHCGFRRIASRLGDARNGLGDDDVVVGSDKQRRGGDPDGTDWDRCRDDAWSCVRSVFDGGCDRCVVGLSHSDWPSIKHDSDGAGRLSVWRLFQVGVPAGNRDRHRLDSAHHVGMAVGDIGSMTGGGA